MADHAQPAGGFILGNTTYEKVRHAVQYWIPAIGTFYAAVASIWGLPFAIEVVGSLTALATLLGVILGVSKSTYYKNDNNFDGALIVDEERNVSLLDVQTSLAQMSGQESITLKVKHQPGTLTPMSEQNNDEDASQD